MSFKIQFSYPAHISLYEDIFMADEGEKLAAFIIKKLRGWPESHPNYLIEKI